MTTGPSSAAARTPFDGGVFISYRRSLAGGHAGHLYAKLRAEYGARRVFFDESAIPKGADFPAEINAALDRAHVILIVIANGWAENMAERAEREDVDWVLHEVERALQRRLDTPPAEVRVVLVGRATMPDKLPKSIAALQTVNANALDREAWDERNSAFQELMGDVRAAMPQSVEGFDLPDLWTTISNTVRCTLTSDALVGLSDFDALLSQWQQRELSQRSACEPAKALVNLKAAIFAGRKARRLSRDGLPEARRVRDVQDACLKLVAAWLRLGACQLASQPGVLGDGRRPAELETLAAHLFALAARDQRQASVRFEPGTAGRRRQIPLARAFDQGTVTSGIGSDRSASILDQLWLMGTGNTLEDRPYSHDPQHARDVRDVASSIRSLNREDGQSRVTIALTGADPAKAGAELLREWLARLKLNVDVIVRTGTTDADHSQDEDDLIYPAWECLVQIEGIGCDAPK